MIVDLTDQVVSAPLLQSDLLSQVPGVVHGITSRVPGMGLADGNVAYSPPRDQEDAWAMRVAWCATVGLDPDSIVTAGQVHGSVAQVVQDEHRGIGARPGSGRVALCDTLVTRHAGPVLLTLHADCLPIILVDPDLPAVASVHAGWRGTVANAAGAAVRTMSKEFGSDPARILAFLGPSICQQCYEVGEDVASAWRSQSGAWADEALDQSRTRRFILISKLRIASNSYSPVSLNRGSRCRPCAQSASTISGFPIAARARLRADSGRSWQSRQPE